jgi:radical SAM superfamily enzyme YgiQ (UPF0313 family)
MRVLLISANTERLSMVTIPLGLGLVAAALRRAGYDVEFLDLLAAPDPDAAVRAAVASFGPEAIGVSVRNIDDQNEREPRFLLEKAKDVVAACRACTSAPVVLGGAGYSIFPREALAYLGADYGVRGDGEEAFPALLERLQRGESVQGIPGVYAAKETTDEGLAVAWGLDDLPLWDEALDACADPSDPDFWVPVQSRRGCPNDCSYCSTWMVQGRPIRCRSPRRVAEEVARLAGRGFKRFYFVDNAFNMPEEQGVELCRHLTDLGAGVTWRCILYPHHVSEALARAMAEAGCADVALGFESGSSRMLAQFNKHFTPEDVRRVSGLVASHGIRRFGFLLLGGPGETRETVEESIAFMRTLGLDEVQVTVGIRIYPGTPLARRALREGVIRSEEALLAPRFYLSPGLAPWIYERTAPERLWK